MTESRAFLLILLGSLLLEAVALLGLIAVGVRGPALGLGLIGPLALASYLNARAVMRYGSSGRKR